MSSTQPYVGRFAPSPTGPLHAGSLVAALASYLDAKAHGGRWLLRIENTDYARCSDEAAQTILQQLLALGLVHDGPVLWQHQRSQAYAAAMQRLASQEQIYACTCSRKDIEAVWAARGRVAVPGEETPYPGTCRAARGGSGSGRTARAWRLHTGNKGNTIAWLDRRLGPQAQDVASAVGDFVLQRADGPWAYQLAVVVDDAAQGVSDVVRGEDLADNTARQILLQRALDVPTPRYLHTPLVYAADGRQKLSKQSGAAALNTEEPLACLQAAGRVLGIEPGAQGSVAAWLQAATATWAQAWAHRELQASASVDAPSPSHPATERKPARP
jgi:glutamyl-Q tRNA(Asp) synthetase